MLRFLMKLQGKKILPQIKEYFSEKLGVTVVIRRCQLCFKKAKLRVRGEFMGVGIAMALCKKCFKKMFPEYTIDTCVICSKKENCPVQKVIFNEKELQQLGKMLNAKDFELI